MTHHAADKAQYVSSLLGAVFATVFAIAFDDAAPPRQYLPSCTVGKNVCNHLWMGYGCSQSIRCFPLMPNALNPSTCQNKADLERLREREVPM
jgi:hypothetical protein